jgi:hypothetical protein
MGKEYPRGPSLVSHTPDRKRTRDEIIVSHAHDRQPIGPSGGFLILVAFLCVCWRSDGRQVT